MSARHWLAVAVAFLFVACLTLVVRTMYRVAVLAIAIEELRVLSASHESDIASPQDWRKQRQASRCTAALGARLRAQFDLQLLLRARMNTLVRPLRQETAP